MSSILAKTIITFVNPGSKKIIGVPLTTTKLTNKRFYVTEADPEDYGYFPDPLEQASGREKKMLLARLAGDDVG